MFCINCGTEIADGTKFCPHCGQAVAGEASPKAGVNVTSNATTNATESEPSAPKKKSHRGVIIGVVVALLACGFAGGALFYNSDGQKIKRALSRADNYLANEDNDEAISSYEEVLSIDQKNEVAYEGIAEAYQNMEEYEDAIQTLEDGVKATGSTALDKKADVVTKEYLDTICRAYTQYVEANYDEEELWAYEYDGCKFLQLDDDIIPEFYIATYNDSVSELLSYYDGKVISLCIVYRGSPSYNRKTGDYYYYDNSGGESIHSEGWCHYENGKNVVEGYAEVYNYVYYIGDPKQQVSEEEYEAYRRKFSNHQYAENTWENTFMSIPAAYDDYLASL